MKNLIFTFLTFLACQLFAQSNYTEVVHLKNGNKIYGVILEQIPNDKIKIQSLDGSTFVFKYSEIEKITKEISKPVQTSPAPQTPSYSPVSKPANVYMNSYSTGGSLQNGTPIFVKLLNTVSSAAEDMPNFVVNGDVRDANGNVLIPDGAQVRTETEITPRKAIGRAGKVAIKFISTTSVDGQIIMLTGSKSFQAKDKKGKVIGIAVGVGTTLLWPMYAYLAKKGDDIEVPAGTLVTNNILVVGNYTIK